jgi:hypothetical protein
MACGEGGTMANQMTEAEYITCDWCGGQGSEFFCSDQSIIMPRCPKCRGFGMAHRSNKFGEWLKHATAAATPSTPGDRKCLSESTTS